MSGGGKLLIEQNAAQKTAILDILSFKKVGH